MRILLIFLTVFFVACANTAKKLNHLSVGMTKIEVIDVLGEPDETRAAESVEYMLYELRKDRRLG